MNKVLKSLIAAVLSATFTCSLAACGDTSSIEDLPATVDAGSWIVTSPDGEIRADMKLDSAGSLTYTVKRGTELVVEPSNLGLDIAEDDFRVVSVDKVTERRVQGVYRNKSGKSASVEYDCNELTLTLKGYAFYLDVVMRAYDDGYAFRYNLRAIDGSEGTVTVENENSEFAMPSSSTVWTQVYQPINAKGNFFAYENSYVRRSANNLQDEYLSFPVLYRLKGSETYSLVTESELIGSGFYGSFLKEAEGKGGTGVLQTVPTPAGCMENDNRISYPFTSPWRVGITGDLGTVIESELVEKVYDDAEYWKPDNYDELSEEEQEIYNYDWVDTGVAAWNWLLETSINGKKQSDYNMHLEYLDLAAEMGWKYVLLDSGWLDANKTTITNFMSKADELGIKVMVWCDALVDFATKELLQIKLDQWAAYGIAGIKIDFFDGQNAKAPTFYGEDTGTISWYETIYQECAKRKMLVSCHGSNKPTGERRIYPNVINREAIYGNEFKTTSAIATVNSMFTRGVIGPTDFTPTVNPLGSLSTVHQMALAVLYESGTPSMADQPSAYLNNDLTDFYKAIPALRDKTVFVGGEPDSYYCAAIKSGNEWIVAGINSVLESTVEIDFSFLGSGTYTGYFYFDTDETLLGVKKEEITVTSATKLTVTMKESGGFVYHLKKQS